MQVIPHTAALEGEKDSARTRKPRLSAVRFSKQQLLTIRMSPMMVASESIVIKAYGIVENAIADVERRL
jgi:hypothetical protein